MKKNYLIMEYVGKDTEEYQIFKSFDNKKDAKECCQNLMQNGVIYFHPKFLIGQRKTIPRYHIEEKYI